MTNNSRLPQSTAGQLGDRGGIWLCCVALAVGVALQIWRLRLFGVAANFAGAKCNQT